MDAFIPRGDCRLTLTFILCVRCSGPIEQLLGLVSLNTGRPVLYCPGQDKVTWWPSLARTGPGGALCKIFSGPRYMSTIRYVWSMWDLDIQVGCYFTIDSWVKLAKFLKNTKLCLARYTMIILVINSSRESYCLKLKLVLWPGKIGEKTHFWIVHNFGRFLRHCSLEKVDSIPRALELFSRIFRRNGSNRYNFLQKRPGMILLISNHFKHRPWTPVFITQTCRGDTNPASFDTKRHRA